MDFGIIPQQLDFTEIKNDFDGGLVEDSFLEDHHPVGFSESTTDPIEFFVRGTEHYIEPQKSYFLFEGQVVGTSNTKVVDTGTDYKGAKEDTSFQLVQNFWHTLFSSVDISMNDTSLSLHNSNYPYVAYIQNLVNLSSDQQKTSGPLCGWTKLDSDRKKSDYRGHLATKFRAWFNSKHLS